MVFKDKNRKQEKELKNILRQLCDHRYFQRLRRIKQLGGADLVFPGAVHTRFNHSLGVCYLTNRIADNLKLGFNDKKLLMISGLLHDIGHGPLSHTFEHLYHKENEIKHDNQWLNAFLANYKIDDLNEELILNIKHLVSSEKYKDIPPNLTLLRDIISSNLDADRLDYLLRDSHFCGVPYGEIDLEWILSSLMKIKIENNPKKYRLGINWKGIGAIEDFLCARRLMTRNIYYHGKVKSTEYYIAYFLKELARFLKEDEEKTYEEIPSLKGSNLANFLRLTEPFIIERKEQDEIEKYINDSFHIYSQLSDDDIWLAIKMSANSSKKNNFVDVAKCLIDRNLPDCYALSPSRINYTEQIVNDIIEKHQLEKWQLKIDTHDHTSYKHEKSPILINETNGGYADIYHESNLLNFLSDKKEYNNFIYISKNIKENVIDEIFRRLNKGYCFTTPIKKF